MSEAIEVLNLRRMKSGIFTGIKGQLYVTQKQIAEFVSGEKAMTIVDHVTGLDITDEIINSISGKNNRRKEIKNKVTKDDFFHASDDEVQAKILETSKDNTIDFEFNFVDLFCGAGGLSVGLEKAGMKCILGTDINTYAMQSFRHYHSNSEFFCGPIWSLTEEILKEKIGNKKVHLVCGGPPCQGFSTIGRGESDDQRNQLFKEFIRIVRTLNPTYILFENVAGLLAKKNRETLNAVITSFEALGYRLKIKVLQAQHYGVPQRRRRTIILGCRDHYYFGFPKPIFDCVENNKYVRPVNLGEVIDDIYIGNNTTINHNEKIAIPLSEITIERIKHIPEGRGIRYKEDEDELFPQHLKLDVDWDTIKEGRLREIRYHRLSKSEPSPTINTGNDQYFHPEKNRRFTVRELARIQTFPNDFEFFGNYPTQKKLVGNAVPVLMAKAIGNSITQSFREKNICNDSEKISLGKEIANGFHYCEYLEITNEKI